MLLTSQSWEVMAKKAVVGVWGPQRSFWPLMPTSNSDHHMDQQAVCYLLLPGRNCTVCSLPRDRAPCAHHPAPWTPSRILTKGSTAAGARKGRTVFCTLNSMLWCNSYSHPAGNMTSSNSPTGLGFAPRVGVGCGRRE